MKGLEIGPLTNPKVRKEEGPVLYLDHASTDDLREKYSANQQLSSSIDAIVDVDIVQGPGQTLVEATRATAPFDYIVVAHVLEHIPDFVGWLAELEEVLAPDGIVSLVLPDMRYTFDLNRRLTDVADVIDAYLSHLTQPNYRQMYDWFAHTVTIDGMVDAEGIWAGTIDYSHSVRTDVPNPAVAAYEECARQAAHRTYLDIHCHAFTPLSFLDIFATLVELDLVNYEIGAFTDTRPNAFEFHVSLRTLTPHVPREAMRQRQRSSVEAARLLVRPDPASAPEHPTDASTTLTRREVKLLAAAHRLSRLLGRRNTTATRT